MVVVSINAGTPNSWLDYFMENAHLKWMRTGGTPISGNLYVYLILSTPMPCNLI